MPYTYVKFTTNTVYEFKTGAERDAIADIDRVLAEISSMALDCDLNSKEDIDNVLTFISQRAEAAKKILKR